MMNGKLQQMPAQKFSRRSGLMAFGIAAIPEFNGLDATSGQSCGSSLLILHKQREEQGTDTFAERFIEKFDLPAQAIFDDFEIAAAVFSNLVVFKAAQQ